MAGEQALVERILAPLIENAYGHASRTVRISIERDAAAVRFTIDDDGPGIASTEQEAIFEPGHRIREPGSSESSSNGAGLGLALSRRLARSAGGDVNAEPSETGARFVARIPSA